jgi:pSer/pThr/pTyr-binding forkhead associated (FHA) protein
MTADRAFALRFISGKYQGGEYPLQENGELVIGRSSELDMVLIEDMVSRKHAKISLQPGQITIADLGSTNGTFVNGEKVKRARLKEGDRILIGTSILKLVGVMRPAGVPAIDNKAAQQQLERSALAQEKRTGGRTAVQGRLEEVPLVDLLQLLSTSKKTGAIVIKGYRGGRVHLRLGKVVSAVIDADPTLPPKKALYRMIGWAQGGFEFVPQEGELSPMPSEITEGTEQLLMEAMHQQDELSRGNLPAATAAIGIAMPLMPRLRDLPPDEVDLVQLVHNYGVVQAVLDRAAGSDLEVSQKLAALIQRGYLRQF